MILTRLCVRREKESFSHWDPAGYVKFEDAEDVPESMDEEEEEEEEACVPPSVRLCWSVNSLYRVVCGGIGWYRVV